MIPDSNCLFFCLELLRFAKCDNSSRLHHAAWHKQMFCIFLYVPLQSNFSLGKLDLQPNNHLALQNLQAICPLIWRALSSVQAWIGPLGFAVLRNRGNWAGWKLSFPSNCLREITEIASHILLNYFICKIISYIISFCDQRWKYMWPQILLSPNFIFLSGTYSYFAVVFFHFTCIFLQ